MFMEFLFLLYVSTGNWIFLVFFCLVLFIDVFFFVFVCCLLSCGFVELDVVSSICCDLLDCWQNFISYEVCCFF